MRSVLFVAIAAAALAACGKEIGDECILDVDCDPNGAQICADQNEGGYCTIRGCDWNTCPEDSACIRFFTNGFNNLPCDPATEDRRDENGECTSGCTDDCSLDELCSLEGLCVPRSSESRFCMATCGDDGDCRDGYECRTLELMKAHGGQPVLEPGLEITERSAPKFCAIKPVQ